MAKERKKKQSSSKANSAKKENNIVIWNPDLRFSILAGSLLGLTLILIVFLRFIQDDIFLFSDIGSDSLNVQYPDYIFQNEQNDGRTDQYSFYTGMGDDAKKYAPKPLIDKLLRAPIELIQIIKLGLGTMIGSNEPPRSIALNFMWNIWLTFMAMWGFIYSQNKNGLIATLGALSFGLSGYVALGSTWWHSGLVFVFLLFAVEQWIRYRRWYFIPFAIYLLYFYTYWFAGSFALLYGVLRLIEREEWKQPHFIRFLGISIGAVLIGFLLSAPEIEQSLGSIVNSPRGEGMFGSKTVTEGAAKYENALRAAPLLSLEESDHYATAILRTYSPDLLGNGSNFRGWGNYLEAPNFYVGLLLLLLIPQLFWLADRKKKILFGSLLGVSFLLVLFPKFRHAFYFFTGDYYKQALNYLIPISLIIAGTGAVASILEQKKVNLKVLGGTLLSLLVILYLPYSSVKEGIVDEMRQFAAVMLVLSAVSIFIWWRSGFNWKGATLMVVVLCIDLGYNGAHMMNEREAVPKEFFEKRIGYNDFTIEAIDYIHQQKSPNDHFYRIEKNYSSGPSMHSSLNDALVFGYRGTQSYSSFNQIYYIRFLQQYNIIPSDNETATRWAPGVKNNLFLHGLGHVDYTLMAPRYQINNNILQGMQQNGIPVPLLQAMGNRGQSRIMNNADFRAYVTGCIGLDNFERYGQQIMNFAVISYPNYQSPTYESIGNVEDVTILRNKMSMPLGSVYDHYIRLSELATLETLQKQIASYFAVVLEDTVNTELQKFDIADLPSNYTWNDHEQIIAQRANSALSITAHNKAWSQFTGQIKITNPSAVYFGIPYDENWNVQVNGEQSKMEIAHGGMMCLLLPAGSHVVSLQYKKATRSRSSSLAWAGLGLFVLGGAAEVFVNRKKNATHG